MDTHLLFSYYLDFLVTATSGYGTVNATPVVEGYEKKCLYMSF